MLIRIKFCSAYTVHSASTKAFRILILSLFPINDSQLSFSASLSLNTTHEPPYASTSLRNRQGVIVLM